MSYVDDAFAKLKGNLEITDSESESASRRHQNIRDLVRNSWDVDEDFLTGSYKRDTKTKPLKDVDIFIVLDPDGSQGDFRAQAPGMVLRELKKVLDVKYEAVTIDRMACVVSFGSTEEVLSMDVVPAFPKKKGGYEIPDTNTGGWIATDPEKHQEMSTEKNKACGLKYVPFVKMIKGINRELGEPVKPSFLLEVMANTLVKEPFGRYQDEVRLFLASASEQVENSWPDPAGLGPDVNSAMNANAKRQAAEALRRAQEIAEDAVLLEDDGEERAAVERWRELFGGRMPRP